MFAQEWEKLNVNPTDKKLDGRGTLDYMLAKNNCPNGEVTPRDREVAATVIQWLGSPVGHGFLSSVL